MRRLDPPPTLWPRDPPVRFRKSVPTAWLPALRAARQRGVAIVRGSRASGCVEPDANADDSGEGWLTAGDLPPPKARIALMLGLATGLSGDSLRSALLACGS